MLDVTRRRFLAVSGVTAGAALAAGATTRPWTALMHQAAVNPRPTGTGVLVLVTLYGGNDGLNTVVPYADPVYHAARPQLAYAEHEVLPLADGLGLNPSMTGLKALWDRGRLTVVRGVGYPDPDRSHFRSMAIWQTGSPGSPQPSGWLGRWLDATGTDPLRAVAVGPTPPLLAGLTTAGAPSRSVRWQCRPGGSALRCTTSTRRTPASRDCSPARPSPAPTCSPSPRRSARPLAARPHPALRSTAR